jgi:uncharacterized protein YidB (DUF937 family)
MIAVGRAELRRPDMGLLDILNTIQNTMPPPSGGTPSDPRARTAPGSAAGGQGMSPMAKALLALLAIYAVKNMKRSDSPAPKPGGTVTAGKPGGAPAGDGGLGGGLGDLLKGPLGGILGGTLGGAAAGTILNGGLGDLLKQLQENGQGDVAKSWVGTGANKAISQRDLANALGSDTLEQLTGETGMSQDDLLGGLIHSLPRFVDQLTPDGRLPTDDEARRMI